MCFPHTWAVGTHATEGCRGSGPIRRTALPFAWRRIYAFLFCLKTKQDKTQQFLLASSKLLFVNITLGFFETRRISISCLVFVSLRAWFAFGDARLWLLLGLGRCDLSWMEAEGNLVPFRHLVKHNKQLPVSRKSLLSFFFFFSFCQHKF